MKWAELIIVIGVDDFEGKGARRRWKRRAGTGPKAFFPPLQRTF